MFITCICFVVTYSNLYRVCCYCVLQELLEKHLIKDKVDEENSKSITSDSGYTHVPLDFDRKPSKGGVFLLKK